MIFLKDFEEKSNMKTAIDNEQDEFTKSNLENHYLSDVDGGFVDVSVDNSVDNSQDNRKWTVDSSININGNYNKVVQMGNTTALGNVENSGNKGEGLTNEQKFELCHDLLDGFFD